MSYPRTEVVYQRAGGAEVVVADPTQGMAIQPADWQATDEEVIYEVWIRTHLSSSSVHNSPKTSVTLRSAASGGTVTTFTGNGSNGTAGVEYRVHTFTGDGNFELRYPRTVDHLIVGGGGGGGSRHGGGGGGGGVLSGSGSRGADTYRITIGAGGKGRDASTDTSTSALNAASGANSTAFGLSATGGGRGGSGGSRGNAETGGSGGGSQSSTGAVGTTGQGGAGGNGQGSPNWSGGGGGGAGAVGGNSSGTAAAQSLAGGAGGAGIASTISGTSVTYGGGGGGSIQYNVGVTAGRGGVGGAGGGGTGGHLGWELFDTLDAGRWELFNTSGISINGSTSNHPSTRAEFDTLVSGSAASRGRRSTSSLALLDWTSKEALATATGLTVAQLPNGGDNFAFVLRCAFVPKTTKTYEFTLSSDDSADLFITTNSTFTGVDPVVSHYGGRGTPSLGTTNGTISLTAGTVYRMMVRQHERNGGEGLRLFWRTANTNDAWAQDADEVPVIPLHPANASDFESLIAASIRTAIGSGVITTQTGTSTANLLNWTNSNRSTVFSGITFPNSGDRFTIRIVGTFVPSETGTYTFTITGDDAVDLSIDGNVVTSHYGAHAMGNLGVNTGTVSLIAGQPYVIRVRHQEGDTDDGLRVFWRKPSQSGSSDWFQDVAELGVGSNGTDGLGGGGGGAGNSDGTNNAGTNFHGGRGGSGVVIVRYPARVTPAS